MLDAFLCRSCIDTLSHAIEKLSNELTDRSRLICNSWGAVHLELRPVQAAMNFTKPGTPDLVCAERPAD